MTIQPQDTVDAAGASSEVDIIQELDNILDDLRTRNDETPQWDFCEGFMVAMICCRRAIEPAEYLTLLLGIPLLDEEAEGSFSGPAQAERFNRLWLERWGEISKALSADVDNLADKRAYYPEVPDVRGALAAMSPEARAEVSVTQTVQPPAYAQVWALGFMYAVESWAEEWTSPRDKQAAKALDACLQDMVALTEDDTDPPTVSALGNEAPPSISAKRLDLFTKALWSVYDLYALWRDIGPRGQTLLREPTPGRNAPCFCGSGKKYKKCHGA